MKIDLSFPHRYAVRRTELPSGKGPAPTVHYHPEPHPGRGEHWGLMLEIAPEGGQAWIGVFEGLGGYLSAVLSTPNPSELLVIADGQPYLVKVDDPKTVEDLPCLPTTQAMPILAWQMIILVDFTDLVAIGGKGILWRSERLVTDELRLVGVEGGVIKATGWSGGQGDVAFDVDPATGRIIGPGGPDDH